MFWRTHVLKKPHTYSSSFLVWKRLEQLSLDLTPPWGIPVTWPRANQNHQYSDQTSERSIHRDIIDMYMVLSSVSWMCTIRVACVTTFHTPQFLISLIFSCVISIAEFKLIVFRWCACTYRFDIASCQLSRLTWRENRGQKLSKQVYFCWWDALKQQYGALFQN